MIRILMLSPEMPVPANTGGLVRIKEIARGLSRFHEVVFVAPIRELTPTHDSCQIMDFASKIIGVPSKKAHLGRKIVSLFSSLPYHTSLYYEPAMARLIDELLTNEPFSLLYLHFLYTLPYVRSRTNLPIVIDQHNVDREYWQRKAKFSKRLSATKLISRLNLHRTVRFENSWLDKITGYVSVSDLDCAKTIAYAGSKIRHFFVAPNGVDLEKFRVRSYATPTTNETVLGFLGSFDLAMNRNAALYLCRTILPRIRAAMPGHNYRVLLVGRNPPRNIRGLAEEDSSIEVAGTVPEVQPYLQQMDLMILPLQEGAGTKLRTVEAMACGLPVIGSPLAFEGITGIVDGFNAYIATNEEAFCTIICKLSISSENRRAIGLAARSLVESAYSWEHITRTLARQLEQMLLERSKNGS